MRWLSEHWHRSGIPEQFLPFLIWPPFQCLAFSLGAAIETATGMMIET